MKTPLYLAVAILAAVVIFPPVERVTPGAGATRIEGDSFPGDPETRQYLGFMFIGKIGVHDQVRLNQWAVEVFAVVAAGLLLAAGARRAEAVGG